MRELVYADRARRSFSVLDDRPGPLGAKTLMGLFPKDVKANLNFLNIWATFGAQVSDKAYGYLIATEGENFTRFHSDFDETIDNLITLYGCGTKTWFFVKPGKLAKKLELDFRTPELFLECLLQHGHLLTCCLQNVGDTIYLPYGFVHWVVTVNNIAGCASLLSVGLRVPKARYERVWQTVASTLPVSKRRWTKYEDRSLHRLEEIMVQKFW